MREIIIEEEKKDRIKLSDIHEYKAIFAKQNGHLGGMVVKMDRGWVLLTGGEGGATGYHDTRKGCLESCLKHGYTFFVDF